MKLRCRTLVMLALPLFACTGRSSTPQRAAPPPAPGVAAAIAFDAHLLVDQFGYRPADTKVAVIRSPHVGFDANSPYAPSPRYEVRKAADGSVAYAAAPLAWQGGAVEASSGDSGWWFDFSTVAEPGAYFIYDPQRKVRSAAFHIEEGVYRNILNAALKMYYYQRSGTEKRAPYAESCWTDGPAYLGADQDLAAHDITDRNNPRKFRNVAGGWFDAGDTNKYVTFASQPVHQLLAAYAERPQAFTDDVGIPESGNGVADVLDEVKWETDWLKKMQSNDGGVALKVGEIVYAAAAPPSSDRNTRYYVPTCSSSTIAAAGMFAHAAVVFGGVPALASEAAELKLRALAAWNHYQQSPKQEHCDSGEVHAGNADWAQDAQNGAAVAAAVYLFALTHASQYEDYVGAHYREAKPYNDVGWSRYVPEQGEALLWYATLPHANGALQHAILEDKRQDLAAGNQVYGFRPEDDLYRAFLHDAQYHWGSNNPRAAYGNTNIDAITYGVAAQRAGDLSQRALEILHYFHGVNPLAMVYLSNMYSYGVQRSANEIYHTWYAHGTEWSNALTSTCGPAPGYVPGGPNAGALRSGVPASIAPPTGQPPQKSYKDWNAASPDSSWAITEPAIYYQSGYVKLLSKFVP